MPKRQMKWSTFLSLFKAKESKRSPTTKEVTCGRRVGTASKAKAHFSKQKKSYNKRSYLW